MDVLEKAFSDSAEVVDPQIFLERLRRVLRLRREHGPELNQKGLGLLDRCIFFRYVDCRSAGFDKEARELIKSHRA